MSHLRVDLVDAQVSLPHYAEHLQPILDALPDRLRGDIWLPQGVADDGYGPFRRGYAPAPSEAPVLVGGYQDLRFGRRPKVLVQHGAGQTYAHPDSAAHASFAGGPGHDMADLFICPSERVASLERTRYPGRPAVAVGCPKLDGWARVPAPRTGVIAVTFHWQQNLARDIPESGSAFPDWYQKIAQLAEIRPVIAHAHPRAIREVVRYWEQEGIQFFPHARDLLDRADILLVDNSSLGYEWAALDRHTVWLRGRTWSHTRHGLRFGEPLPGPELMPDATIEEIIRAADDGAAWAPSRAEVTGRVYGGPPGTSATRAAAAILDCWPG